MTFVEVNIFDKDLQKIFYSYAKDLCSNENNCEGFAEKYKVYRSLGSYDCFIAIQTLSNNDCLHLIIHSPNSNLDLIAVDLALFIKGYPRVLKFLYREISQSSFDTICAALNKYIKLDLEHKLGWIKATHGTS